MKRAQEVGPPGKLGDNVATMELQEFQQTLSEVLPPEGLSPALLALWWDGKGDWDKAHGFAQSDKSDAAQWVHAYLHRVEGDLSNAGYWYRRVGKPACNSSLADEWREIAAALL